MWCCRSSLSSTFKILGDSPPRSWGLWPRFKGPERCTICVRRDLVSGMRHTDSTVSTVLRPLVHVENGLRPAPRQNAAFDYYHHTTTKFFFDNNILDIPRFLPHTRFMDSNMNFRQAVVFFSEFENCRQF